MPPIISMRPSNQQRANVVAHLEKAVNPCDAVTSSAKRRGIRHFAATGVAFLHSGTVSGMALVEHADANRHALLNTRKVSCVFNLQALQANPNSQPPRGGPGAMHSGLCSR
jgi:hypothetical protein